MAHTVSIDRERLHHAAAAAGVDRERADAVWAALTAPREGEERFDAPHVAFYVGGLLVLSAFTWLMGEAWNEAGVGAALAMSLVAAAALSLLSAVLRRRGWRVPGGLVATVVVALVPLIVYSFERVVGLWPDRDLGEYGEAALMALRLVGFPFLVMPLAFVAWFASMDFTEVVFGEDASDNARAGVSADTLLFPLAIAILGLAVMAFGIALARFGKAWAASISDRLPPSVQLLLPPAKEPKSNTSTRSAIRCAIALTGACSGWGR
jgi:hypothetical protein